MSFQDTKLGKRKTVNMSEDIATELNRIANMSGKTLYSLINEIGLSAIAAKEAGFDLEEAVMAKKVMDRAKKSRMVLVNQDLWYFASSQANRASKPKWQRMVRDSAQWQANVFLAEEEGKVAGSVASLLRDYYWDCGDVKVEQEEKGGNISLRMAFVPEMPLEHTQVLFKTFEVMLNTKSYFATRSTVEPGFVTINFKKVSTDLHSGK